MKYRTIKNAFDHGKAFIPFITAGDPDLESTKEFILAMEKAGADLVEIGIPFSDPIAEGIVIQEADIRALASGTTTDKIFEMVEELRRRLVNRGTDTMEVIEDRLAKAEYELTFADRFDHVVVNDDLAVAEAETYRIVRDFFNDEKDEPIET